MQRQGADRRLPWAMGMLAECMPGKTLWGLKPKPKTARQRKVSDRAACLDAVVLQAQVQDVAERVQAQFCHRGGLLPQARHKGGQELAQPSRQVLLRAAAGSVINGLCTGSTDMGRFRSLVSPKLARAQVRLQPSFPWQVHQL